MTMVTPQSTALPHDEFALEDTFLLLYTLVDDLYKELVPEAIQARSQHERIELSDSEVLTLSIVQEALSMDSEESFCRFIRRNYLALFPRLLSRDRYSRRRMALTEVTLLIYRYVAAFFRSRAEHFVVDSAPVETAAFVRSQSASVSMPEGAYGYIPAKKRHFFGFRLHGVVTQEGALVDFVLSPANEDERTVAQVLLKSCRGHCVLAYNGYSGPNAAASAQRNGYGLWASPKPSQAPASREQARLRRWLRSKRDLIETVFAMLSDQFKLETTRALSLAGLKARMIAKLLSFNMSLFVNHLLGRDLLAVKSLYL